MREHVTVAGPCRDDIARRPMASSSSSSSSSPRRRPRRGRSRSRSYRGRRMSRSSSSYSSRSSSSSRSRGRRSRSPRRRRSPPRRRHSPPPRRPRDDRRPRAPDHDFGGGEHWRARGEPGRGGSERYGPRSRGPGADAAGHYGPGGTGREQAGSQASRRIPGAAFSGHYGPGGSGTGRELAGSQAPRKVPSDPPNVLVRPEGSGKNFPFAPPAAFAPPRRPKFEVGAASRRKFGILGKTLAAARADTSRDRLGGDLAKLPPAAQRALRARIQRGALRPSEVTRDAKLFSALCALPPAKADAAVEAFLGMLDREQGNRPNLLRRAVRQQASPPAPSRSRS